MPKLLQIAFQFGDLSSKAGYVNHFAKRYIKSARASCCVVDHYYWHFGRVDIAGAKKLILKVDDPANPVATEPRCDPHGIAYFPLSYDYERAEQLEGRDLKIQILDSVHKAVCGYCKFAGCDIAPAERAYEKVIEDDLRFGFYLEKGKAWKDPKSKLKAKLFIKFDWNELSIVAEMLSGRALIGSAFMHSTCPVVFDYRLFIHNPKWKAGAKFSVTTAKFPKFEKVVVSVSEKDCSNSQSADTVAWGVQNPQSFNA